MSVSAAAYRESIPRKLPSRSIADWNCEATGLHTRGYSERRKGQRLEIRHRTVALFDVLGFKDLVRDTPLHELANRYGRVAEYAAATNRPQIKNDPDSLFPKHPADKPWCIQYIFSDSVILVADDSSVESTLRLLVYSWRLFQYFLVAGFPLRGGVAHGEMAIDPGARMLLGRALVDAYELESSQAWVGAAIDDSVFEAHPSLKEAVNSNDHFLGDVFRREKVPFKSEVSRHLHTLNWRFNLVVEKGTRSLFPRSEGPAAHPYQVRALEYARAVVMTGHVYPQTVPLELRRFYVGSAPPPSFGHGDDL